MGRPKHLLDGRGGKTWLENTIARPAPSGRRHCRLRWRSAARSRGRHLRLAGYSRGCRAADRHSCGRPLAAAGVLAACGLRYAGCFSRGGELAAGRPPGRMLGTGAAGLPGSDRPEPLLAWYDFRAIQLLRRTALYRKSADRRGRRPSPDRPSRSFPNHSVVPGKTSIHPGRTGGR